MDDVEIRVPGTAEPAGPRGTVTLTSAKRVIIGVPALPPTAVRTPHVHVARIRQALAATGMPPRPRRCTTADSDPS